MTQRPEVSKYCWKAVPVDLVSTGLPTDLRFVLKKKKKAISVKHNKAKSVYRDLPLPVRCIFSYDFIY